MSGAQWRLRFSGGLLVGLILVALSSANGVALVPVGASYYARYDLGTNDVLWGNLTWKNGQGRIVWGPVGAGDTDTEGGGGTPDPSVESMWAADDELESYDGERLAPLPLPDEFVSEAIPRKLFVNLSRGISLDLQVKQNPNYTGPMCNNGNYMSYAEPELNVELLAGTQLLAGAQGFHSIYWYTANPDGHVRPANDPTGFKTCRFGMSPEAAILEAGTVLKLRILHAEQNYFFPYGFGPGHQSSIRIPLYSIEDTIFRYPPDVSGIAEPDEQDSEPMPAAFAEAGLPFLALLGAIPASSARGRGRTWAVVLVLVAVGMSGCLGGGKGNPTASEDLQGSLDNTLIATDNRSTGSIYGQVHDELHIPLKNVHISLIGLPTFTSTDSQGRFKFLNLVPGTYKLRFDKMEFLSYEGPVVVKAGYISKPKVLMVLADPKARELRPHSHDYWTGVPSPKTIADTVYASTCYNSPSQCYVNNPLRLAPQGEDPMILPPGTLDAVVTFTFDSTKWAGVQAMGLAVKTPMLGVEYFTYAPRASGVPFRIPVSWEMSDRGHSPYSSWLFYFYVPTTERPDTVTYDQNTYSPPAEQPSLQMKVVIRKGLELPLESEHPDPWATSDVKEVSKDRPISIPASTYPPESPNFTPAAGKGSCQVAGMIPDGTKTVEMVLKQGRETAYRWVLHYKPANVPYHKANIDTWDGYTTKPRTKEFDGAKTVWKFDLKPEETDFVYGKTTTWLVYFEPDDYDAWWQDSQVDNNDKDLVYKAALGLSCSITAYHFQT